MFRVVVCVPQTSQHVPRRMYGACRLSIFKTQNARGNARPQELPKPCQDAISPGELYRHVPKAAYLQSAKDGSFPREDTASITETHLPIIRTNIIRRKSYCST